METFRWIPGYEGLYDVSDWGRVRSHNYRGTGRLEFLSLNPLKNGYLETGFYRNGKLKKFYVHKLVAMAFLGHTPNGFELVVHHIDENKTNNRLENLEITTQRENTSKQKRDLPTGVSLCKKTGKFKARISEKRTLINLRNPKTGKCLFDTVQEASAAYLKKKAEIEQNNSAIL
jgi:hypothetical protein